MKRIFLLLFMAMMAAVETMAVEQYSRMFLYFKDGTVREFSLCRDTEITTTLEKLVISLEGNRFEFDRNAVSHIKYGSLSDDPNGIEDVEGDESERVVRFIVQENTLYITADIDDGLLSVHSINGCQILRTRINAQTRSVSLEGCRPGIYIAVLNGQSFKFLLK